MKTIIKLFFFFFISFLFSDCGNKESDYIDPRGDAFAGSISCMDCHQKIYNEALNSSHYKASAPASLKNILGNFNTGQNTFHYDKAIKIVMETRKNELFQVYYKNGKEVKAYRFDIVMGSKNAQTAMFWDKDNIYELPLSYYKSVNNWGTSPGYPANQPYFDGSVSTDCFSCHSSHLTVKENQNTSDGYFGTEIVPEKMKKESLVYGIDCERCHGPAQDHVNFHKKNPELKLAKYITTNKSLNHKQKLDQSVICHYAGDNIQSRFKFVIGNSITNFYGEPDPNNTSNLDVHGNQFGLLSKSKCFLESKTMDCISCHNPHKEETKNLLNYSQKCMSCHSEAKNNFCTTPISAGISLKENCIDCHMPKKPSGAIGFYLSGKSEMSPYLLRTHNIGIYPEESLKKTAKKEQ
jgi:predicted CXXCH cytochrome family protein